VIHAEALQLAGCAHLNVFMHGQVIRLLDLLAVNVGLLVRIDSDFVTDTRQGAAVEAAEALVCESRSTWFQC